LVIPPLRKILLLTLIAAYTTACITDNRPSLTGSYYRCLQDGEYQEHRIGENRIMFIGSLFPDDLYFMSNRIHGDTLLISGLNFDLMFGTDTLTIISLTDSSLTLNNRFGDFELKRLSYEIPAIDSLNLEQSITELLSGFRERSLKANCPDLRTEEEKNPDIPQGVVDDNFEDITYIDSIPN
tara:strand:- start:724 stop:1269 length:546 start_codon:yes stop_codon:yes gene_type:complete